MTTPGGPREDRLRLQVIIASTRPGRIGLPVTEWFLERVEEYGTFEVDLADLLEIDLPMMNEPNHPRLHDYTHQHTKDWSARVEAADAFVFVMPEYNYGFSAPLKNAIDYLNEEWQYKPVGFVSYGGVSAGTRAVQMTKEVISAFRMMPIVEAVTIPFVRQFLGEDGKIHANDIMNDASVAMLTEIERVAIALKPLRAPRG
jgi:NAD(P)H-dependent FMN reductase